MKKNKKRSFPIFLITLLTVTLVFELLGIVGQYSKSYDEKYYYEADFTYSLRRNAYTDMIYDYYNVLYKDVKPSKDYKKQIEIGHYFSKAIIANAYKNNGNQKKYNNLKSELEDIRSDIPEYVKYLDDIDDKINALR